MPFFDMPSMPLHHGQAVATKEERVIQPNKREKCEGIEAIGVTKGWCREEQCKQRFFYIRHLYQGGWGPIHRVRDSKQITELHRRLKEARESDWVWGYHKETYGKVKVTVR